jgi:hypothetical protein
MPADWAGGSKIAHALGIPYILMLEFDWQTQTIETVSHVTSAIRSAPPSCTWHFET